MQVCSGQTGVLRKYWVHPTPHQHALTVVWKWKLGYWLTLFTSFSMIPFRLFYTWHHGYSVFFRRNESLLPFPALKPERRGSDHFHSVPTETSLWFHVLYVPIVLLRIKSFQDNRLNSVIISHTEYNFTPAEMARVR